MLDWERYYNIDNISCTRLRDFVTDGIVDWHELLDALSINSVLLVEMTCKGRAEGYLKYSGVDSSVVSKSRLIYSVFALICEMLRNLSCTDLEYSNQPRDVRFYLDVISKIYSANNYVISTDMCELRVKVRIRDKGIKKVIKGSIYTKEEQRNLRCIIDSIQDARRHVKSELYVEQVDLSTIDTFDIRIDGSESLSSLIELFDINKETLYVTVNNKLALKIVGFNSNSELCVLEAICEILWFVGYYLWLMPDSICELFVRLWRDKTIISSNFELCFFKGDYGIVNRVIE